MNTSIGQVTDPTEAKVLSIEALSGEDKDASPEMSDGSLLWEYRYEGRINGVRVADADKNLPIDKDSDIIDAFELVRAPKSEIFIVSTENQEGLKRYNEILEKVYAGEATVLDEMKQFDATKGGFIVWIRYDELHYALDSRHAYLREENAI